MRVAAIAGRLVFDQIAREHDAGVGHHRDHVAGGVAAADMHDAHLAPAEPDRNLIGKRERRPGQPGNGFRGAKQPRKAADLGLHVLLAALGDQPARRIGGQDLGALEGRGAQRPRPRDNGVSSTYLIGLSVTLATRAISSLAIAGVGCASMTMTPSSPTMMPEFGIALGGVGVKPRTDLVERDLLLGGIFGGCKTLGGHGIRSAFRHHVHPASEWSGNHTTIAPDRQSSDRAGINTAQGGTRRRGACGIMFPRLRAHQDFVARVTNVNAMPGTALRDYRSACAKDAASMKILLVAMLFGIILLMARFDAPAPLRLPKAMRMRRLLRPTAPRRT